MWLHTDTIHFKIICENLSRSFSVYGVRGMFIDTDENYYRSQRSCGKVMFSQASVILFTGGGCLPGESVCRGGGGLVFKARLRES